MAKAIPSILVNGNAPMPGGVAANAQFSAGATVTLSLVSDAGFGSIQWLVGKYVTSSAALGASAPSRPFSTTLGPLDVGTYLITCIPDGDASRAAVGAICVLSTPYYGLRLPALGETVEWDSGNGIVSAMYAIVQAIEATIPLAQLGNTGGAIGDIAYWNGSAWVRLAHPGTAGKVLTSQAAGSGPHWV